MTHGAVLVNLTIHQFGNEKTDTKIVQEVAQRHNASFSKDRYLKKLLPPAVMSTIQTQVSCIRAYHYRVTAPWFDRGIRMMAAKFIPIYKEEMQNLIDDLNQYIDTVAENLPQYEAEARRTRGTLYEHMPSAEEFKKAYSVEIELLPVAMEDDFRIDYISNKEKKAYAAKNQKRFAAQTKYLIELVTTPLLRLKGVMSNQERAPKVHGTTIETLDWWCDNISKLLVDRNLEKTFETVAADIKSSITIHYDPNGKPKYDPMAIEGALDCIERTLKEFDSCIQD